MFLRIVLVPLLVFCTPIRTFANGPAKHPNIVFILADDLGINDLSCYGRKDQPTPNLDKLAKQGMRFTSAYSAASVCSPTRAAIMTGQSPARLHLTTFLPGRGDARVAVVAASRDQAAACRPTFARSPNCCKRSAIAPAASANGISAARASLPTDRGFDLYHPGQALTEAVRDRRRQGRIRSDGEGREVHRRQQGPARSSSTCATTIRTSRSTPRRS